MEVMYLDGTYKEVTPSWHTEDSAWKALQIITAINRAGIVPKSVCDIGCGAGEVLWELAERLPEDVTLAGYEQAPHAQAMQRHAPRRRVGFRNEDFLTTVTPHFDLLLAIDVFEHIPDYLGFLQAVRSRADFCLFHIPLELTVYNVLCGGILSNSRKTLGHLHFFDRETALAAVESCGYTIISDNYTNWIEELPHRSSLQPVLRHTLRLLKRICGNHMAVRLLGGHSLLVLAKC